MATTKKHDDTLAITGGERHDDTARYWPSWDRMLDCLDTVRGERMGSRADYERKTKHTYLDSTTWAGAPTWAECYSQARHGWSTGRVAAEQTVEAVMANRDINDLVTRQQDYRRPRRAACGGAVIPGAAIAGDAMAFMAFRKERKSAVGRVGRLYVNVSMICTYTGRDIAAAGRAVWAALDVLRQCGITLDVYWVSGAKATRHGTMTTVDVVRLCGSDTHISPDVLSFALGNPGAPRRIGFGLREMHNPHIRQTVEAHTDGGYGTSLDNAIDLRRALDNPALGTARATGDDTVTTLREILGWMGDTDDRAVAKGAMALIGKFVPDMEA